MLEGEVNEEHRQARIGITDVHKICSEEIIAELPKNRPGLVELSSSIEHRMYELPGQNI